MKVEIGRYIKQKGGYSSFLPNKYPPKGILVISPGILLKASEAERLIGKLDGVTHTLPDVDFFLSMFVAKDATSSSQIEGTKATLIDAIELDSGVATGQTDADDIIFYIKALHYGIKRLETFPLSLRFIRELHSVLMTGARSTHFADPGEFRRSQNWIGGTVPANASFVPPSPDDLNTALSDFETFIRNEKLTLPVVQIALMHAQFETIHPFLDGNGRTGRLLITLMMYFRKLLENPVLFLSSYFKKHQKTYYQKLHDYHNGNVGSWLEFFLDGVIETAKESIQISKDITKLRDLEMEKIQALAKRESESGVVILKKLYSQPIISSKNVMEWTGFSRSGAIKAINRFVSLGILVPKTGSEAYDKVYTYKKYIDIFIK
ncbi:MAG: Filamentation induced by cAMP protein Fic [Candidatus Collierbacteria bacterium GW2011_GWC2_44_18]|uniref:Filamentation induced by cAMP protein Fic n=2 Tax=Microgenomates group TaxID=1794810 RepID=A0A0G1J8F2_9BACT|nr:MAG: Filamentation induced by cAMP protein Fic [Microgenomates group bacterium GW2011_GWC1_44_10]KKT49371.1 MAG: Filamentation induced by cAMP protein Fic [Candidatus Collierbacteria bacterium GW2011_GWC2_44_18]KKT67560.1 MAG: Filamentation induced by cAMP protein Fic [Candidatus Woesebacteria bacterium GW2011_GWA2_44_33]